MKLNKIRQSEVSQDKVNHDEIAQNQSSQGKIKQGTINPQEVKSDKFAHNKTALNVKFSDRLSKVCQIIFFGLIIAALGYFYLDHLFAFGVLVGMPISIFNYFLVVSAVEGLAGETPHRSQNRFMLRTLIRMIISMLALLVSINWGVYFMLGVAMGLILQMITYFKDAVKMLSGKG